MEEIEIKIDQYILGKLTKSEMLELDKVFNSDPSVAALYEERKKIILYGKLLGHQVRKAELKAMIHTDSIESEVSDTTSSANKESIKSPSIFRYVAVAASILFLIGGLWFVTSQLSNSNISNPIVQQYYTPYAKEDVRATTDLTVQDEAIQSYRNGDYEKAITLLTPILKNNIENQLMIGIAHFESNEYTKALSYFNVIANNTSENNLFADKGKWYAALTNIELGKTDIAKTLLKDLSTETEFADDAKVILSEIK